MARNVFNTTPVRKPRRNLFDLGYDHKFTTSLGTLTPILVQEVLPGDGFRIRSENLIRFAPLIAPVMHNVRVFTHYFFVPNRIVWPNWEKFISPDLSKESPPAPPMLNFQDPVEEGSIADYMGLPANGDWTGQESSHVSALPFAAFAKIYNEYYRDQNLQNELSSADLVDGEQLAQPWMAESGHIPHRAWQHDYFTASLPFAQKGPAVDIPIGNFDDLPVLMRDPSLGGPYIRRADGQPIPDDEPHTLQAQSALPTSLDARLQIQIDQDRYNASIDPDGSWYVPTSDLSEASAATINDLRTAMRLQEWFEKAARGGSRYVEQLMVHWNVRSDDARLQRPEFLGGNRQPVIISEVLQTSESQETPQATMAGHGLSASSGKSCRYYAKEHGYIIGIMSVMPATAYQQGIPRHFQRNSWEDYAWPTFAHLGEQEVLNKEIYADGTAADQETFGYIPRYSEYRYTPSIVSGAFQSSLAFWHFGRIFSNRPQLNSEFIECRPRIDVFAVQEDQHLWCHSYHDVKVSRALPRYGVPTL